MHLLGLLLSLLFLGVSFATNVTVTSSLSEAIDSAQDGDTIILPSGVYSGPNNTNLTLYGRSLSFTSESGNFSDVTVDCGGNSSAVLVYYIRTPVNYTGPPLPPNNATTTLSFFGITFANCAGAFYLNATNTTGNNSVWLENTKFTGNRAVYGPRNAARAGNGGGAVYAEGPFTVEISNSVFSQCNGYYGGAVYGLYGANFTVTDCTFMNNIANSSGGAIAVASTSSLSVSSSFFQSNRANYGGAIYTQSYSTTNIETSNFTSNIGSFSGGAINVDTAHTYISGCIFTSNSGSVGGGVSSSLLYATAFVTDCTFISNVALSSGGAVAANSEGSFFLSNSYLTNNLAYSGGAAASMTSSILRLTNVNVTQNNAKQGGAFFIQDKASIVVQSSDVANNSATIYGDTLYCLGSTMTFNDTSINVPSPKEGEQNGIYCNVLPGDNTWCTVHAYDSGDWSEVCTNPPEIVIKKGLAGWKIAVIVIGALLGALILGFVVAYAISTRFEAPSFFQQLGKGERSNTV